MLTIVQSLLAISFCIFVLPTLVYVLLLSAAAPFGLRHSGSVATSLRRMAILVPAHNEALVLGRLLDSITVLDYPKQFYEVFIVADNCTDATAEIARARGATALERFDSEKRSKGDALAWLLDRLNARFREYDAYVFVDADSVLSANFLRAMNKRLHFGAVVAQSYYTTLNLKGGTIESLREIALALVHFLRPAAKVALKASCGLKGNGMCFHRSVLERFGWPTAGLAEDVEFHLTLVTAGIRVTFVPEAIVRAEMPSSLGGAVTQNLRWEAGRLSAARRQAVPLLLKGVCRRNVAQVDAAFEQLLPPLSVPVLISALLIPVGLVARAPLVSAAAVAAILGWSVYVTCGLMLASVPPRSWLALVDAPRYVGWKTLIYLRALLPRGMQPWVRTPHGQVRNTGS